MSYKPAFQFNLGMQLELRFVLGRSVMKKLRTVALAAGLLVASVPVLSTTADARPFGFGGGFGRVGFGGGGWGGGWRGGFGRVGFGGGGWRGGWGGGGWGWGGAGIG